MKEYATVGNELNKSQPFDDAIGKFLNHIESLWTSLPILLKTIEQTKKNSQKEHQSFLQNNCEYIESEGYFVITPEHYRRNNSHKKAVENSTTAIKIIKRNFLVSLISQFDTYIGDMMKAVFSVRPEMINSSEKQLTFSELSKFSSIEEAKESIVEREIETVLRESHSEQFKWFERKLSIPLRKDLHIWETFIEITQRRNLFVHNDGKVSSQYLTVCRENNVTIDDKIKLGDELEVGFKYFDKTFKCLFEIGVKLNQVIRRNLLPTELESADSSFLNISFELIQNRQYDLAKILYDFSDKYIKKYSTEDLRLRVLINRAQTYKWLDKNEECKKIIESVDWSATGEIFKLVSYVLLDKYDEASTVMRNIGANESVLDKLYYKDWPVFRLFRQTEQFKMAYLEIYKQSFEITEENVTDVHQVSNAADSPKAKSN